MFKEICLIYLLIIKFFKIQGISTKVMSAHELLLDVACLKPPFTCPHSKIKFYLYTHNTSNVPELIDTTDNTSLSESQFNRNHKTKIIIHGFFGGHNISPGPEIRDAYFIRDDYNIFVVDYSSAVVLPCPSQINFAPNFGAKCIAELLQYIASHPNGVNLNTIHIIGYSLGVHLAGLIANHLKDHTTNKKIGRITGLDPSIIFSSNHNTSYDLDRSDANFVDIIHTSAGILGQWYSIGHADFYVNGGTIQPGCRSNGIIQNRMCDHTLVTPYFIESITSSVGFYGTSCRNHLIYLLGFCGQSPSVRMGEDASSSIHGIFYVETNSDSPYAKGLS